MVTLTLLLARLCFCFLKAVYIVALVMVILGAIAAAVLLWAAKDGIAALINWFVKRINERRGIVIDGQRYRDFVAMASGAAALIKTSGGVELAVYDAERRRWLWWKDLLNL